MKPIYIILAILWILYGFYKKSLKNKAAQDKASSDPQKQKKNQEKGLLNEIFGDLFSDNPIPKPYESADIQDEIEKANQNNELKKQTEHLNIIKEKISQQPYINFEEIEDNEENTIDIDLRDAIIYSEIIKRPEY